MRRSLVSRIAALAIGTLVGISAPGLAFAHGYAHREASEHAAHEHEHHHGRTDGADEAHHGLTWTAQAADESKDHTHPTLAHALSMRMDSPVFVLPPVPVAAPVAIVLVGTVSWRLTAAPARASPTDAPPRQPRAPPFG